MSHYNLALLGFGNVGRALARLLQHKETELQSRYDITFHVTGISTARHGMTVNPAGLDYIKAVELVEAGESLAALSKTPIQTNSQFPLRREDAAAKPLLPAIHSPLATRHWPL